VEGDTVCVSEKPACKNPGPLGERALFPLSGAPGPHAISLTVDGSSGHSIHTGW
jgi:hypothetical protein